MRDEVLVDVADGVMTVKPRTGDIISRRKFGDIQLHLEKPPVMSDLLPNDGDLLAITRQ